MINELNYLRNFDTKLKQLSLKAKSNHSLANKYFKEPYFSYWFISIDLLGTV